MKKMLMTFALSLIVVLVFGQDSTGVTPGKFESFYEKYFELIWAVAGFLGVSGWLGYRLNKALNFIKVIIAAVEDGKINTQEGRDIIAAGKAVIGKKEK